MKEPGVPEDNYRSTACHWQTLSHNVVSRTDITMAKINVPIRKFWFYLNVILSSLIVNGYWVFNANYRNISWYRGFEFNWWRQLFSSRLKNAHHSVVLTGTHKKSLEIPKKVIIIRKSKNRHQTTIYKTYT